MTSTWYPVYVGASREAIVGYLETTGDSQSPQKDKPSSGKSAVCNIPIV